MCRAALDEPMDIRSQRLIDRVVGSLLCRLLSLWPWREAEKNRPPEKILVILLSEMGSLVLAQPMFFRLRERYPAAELYVLVFAKNRHCLDVIDLVPPENILTVRGDSLAELAVDSLGVLSRMRHENIDTVIDCELFSRISSLYAVLSGAARRVGFHPHTQEGLYRGDFINRRVLYNPFQHISQQFVTLVEAIDSRAVPCGKRPVRERFGSLPRMTLREGELDSYRVQLQRDFPGIMDRPLVLLYPSGGLLPIRAWPLENFQKVAADLLGYGYSVGVIGMAADKPLAQTFLKEAGEICCYDLTGYTRNVRELVVLLHLAALLITNDGGPGHFASLTPVPSLIFYGPETPLLYGPLDPKAVVLHAPISCSPCLTAYNHRNSPCDGNNLCLQSIRVEEVLQRALAELNVAGGEPTR